MDSQTLPGSILNLEELEVACAKSKFKGEENHTRNYKSKYQRKYQKEKWLLERVKSKVGLI